MGGPPLPEAVKEEIARRYLAGEETQDIAVALGLKVLQVENYIHRKPLRRAIEHLVLSAEPPAGVSLEDLFRLHLQAAKVYAKQRPPLIYKRTIPVDYPVILVSSADWHIGDPGVNYPALMRDIDVWSRTPGLYVFAGGDGVNNPVKPDRGGLYGISIQASWDYYALLLLKLKEHLIAVGSGNHDNWTRDCAGIDNVQAIVQALEVFYAGPSGFLDLTVGRQTYKIFRCHKTQFNSSFNATHGLKQMRRVRGWDWEIGIGEHSHVSAFEDYELPGVHIVVMKTGTYKLNDEHARANAYYGSTVANPAVVLWPDKHRFVGFRDYPAAIEYRDGLMGKA